MSRWMAAIVLLAATSLHAAEAFDHVHLTVPEGQTLQAAEWYARQFSGKVTRSVNFDSVLFGEIYIKFKPGKPPIAASVGSGVDHIGFSMPDAAEAMERLEKAGAKITQPAQLHPVGKFVYGFVEDPWGTKIEIIDDAELRGFHHVHLVAKNRDAALAWFSQAFGGEITFFKDVPQLPVIRYGPMVLAVREAGEQVPAATEGRAVDHIGWRVGDLDTVVKKLRELGTKFVVEPRVAPQFGIKLAFIESPGGVKIELQQKLEK